MAANQSISALATVENQSRASGVKQALISLSDKSNLVFLANGLQDLGYRIVSTGGTASFLETAGIPVTKVEELTRFPEMLDGRVKTLHPSIHAGILARRDKRDHMEALNEHGIAPFDVVAVNLYPFVEKAASPHGLAFEDGIENIDIGGPAMIRAAAKNHSHVLVVVEPDDYPALLKFLSSDADADDSFRRKLAWKAFQHVATYDTVVSQWLWKQTPVPEESRSFPASLTVPMSAMTPLRYGENPHQKAAFYADACGGGIGSAVQHHGKGMSYNNYVDADAAWSCVSEFEKPTCVVVKHANPCGIASRGDVVEAYRLAVAADPLSAFGGIVAFNAEVGEDLAREIREFRNPTDPTMRMFYEIVVAPKYSEGGLDVLMGKSKTLRILQVAVTGRRPRSVSLRQVGGGWLAQDTDDVTPDDVEFSVVSDRVPAEAEVDDARFAWLCVKHVKSNAIVVAKDGCMLGMGSGQPNRVESLRIALRKAGDRRGGAALASDAFFPFAWNDAVEEACQSGIAVLVEPGGSVRDRDAIDCCNKYGVSLLFTGVRHFRH